MRSFLAAIAVIALFAGTSLAADLRHFADAPLHAVHFVDESEGWAAGDEGVVWHTIDGGANWERQPTGVRASLRSIHFLNPFIGWIAGREELPYGQGSAGVLLLTRDGGLKWERWSMNAFTGLNYVYFVDPKTGFAVGDGSETFPTGIFQSTDSGQTWKPVPGPRRPSWMAADFQDAQTGALVGASGWLGVLRQNTLVTAEMEHLGGRAVRGVKVFGKKAIAVGQGGLILSSRDSAGARWGYADSQTKLPSEVKASWDFHAVHVLGNDIWIVGRPGSAVLHSPDQGETWNVLRTGQFLPLNGVFFTTASRGWAVGEFGSILGTSDGGKTWQVQHRGGQRAALLCVQARVTGTPLDTVSLIGGEEGYLTTGFALSALQVAASEHGQATVPQRLAAASRQAGGAAAELAWQFPLPQHLGTAEKNDLVKFWNELHADRAPEELLRQLVLALRIWRPSVVCIEGAQSPLDELVGEALAAALGRAADPKSFPEQIQILNLQPWQVAKVYANAAEATSAQVNLDLNRVSPRLESTAKDFAFAAHGLLAETPPRLPGMRSYRLLESTLPGASSHRQLMQGLDFAHGGVARRTQTPLAALDPDFERALRSRRNLQILSETKVPELADPERMLSQIGPMLSGMPPHMAAPAAFGIGSQYARSGQWSLAREVFVLMVHRYPSHPLAAEACRWLAKHDASSEARRRYELQHFWTLTQSKLTDGGQSAEASVRVTGLPEGQHIVQVGHMNRPAEAKQWYQGSLESGKRLAGFGPRVANDPAVQFPLYAARRHLGEFDTAKEWYTQFRNEHNDGPWREAAEAELWLVNRVGTPKKPIGYCRQTTTRPFLDGDFTDPCWDGLKPMTLQNAVGDSKAMFTTEVRLAFDNDFLYLALACKHPPDRFIPPVKVRQQDADLGRFDRVSLMLDLDRDYSTFFNLQVDQRGCVRDECHVGFPDVGWNPKWFVAVRSDKDSWQIEAAIPLRELTGDGVSLGRCWAFNVVRVIPGKGVQAFSIPAEVLPRPEGMGLLVFTQDLKSASPAGPTDKPLRKSP